MTATELRHMIRPFAPDRRTPCWTGRSRTSRWRASWVGISADDVAAVLGDDPFAHLGLVADRQIGPVECGDRTWAGLNLAYRADHPFGSITCPRNSGAPVETS
jgi:hypothetical protein